MSDYEFLNFLITHNSANGDAPSPAVTELNYLQPFIDKIEDYYCCIIRTSIPALSLPLWIPSFVVGSNYSSNTTIYSFTLKYLNFTSGQFFIDFVPTNLNASPFTGTVTTSFLGGNEYYYIYDFWSILKMFNSALNLALGILINDCNAGGNHDIDGADAPYFIWDSARNSAAFSCTKVNYDEHAANRIIIYYNNQMLGLLNGFNAQTIANNAPDGAENLLLIENMYNNTDPADNTRYLTYPVVPFDPSYYNCVNSIALVSSLSVNGEIISAINQNFGGTSLDPKQQQTNTTLNILTDFVLDLSSVQNVNSVFIYNKIDNFRFLDIATTGSQRSLTLQLMFQTIDGSYHPLLLYPNTTANVKIGFIKKSITNSRSDEIINELKKMNLSKK